MKRSLLAVAVVAVTFVAVASHAIATVDVTSVGTPLPGATITLQVRVTVTPADGAEGGIFGTLVYPTSGIELPSPVTLSGGGFSPFPATQVALNVTFSAQNSLMNCNSIRCTMFVQSTGINGPQSANVTNFLISQQSYTILPGTLPGTVLTWIWLTSPTTQQIDFFNFNNSVAPVPALSITVIPEPTTAALLGMGLLGLAAARRRR